MSKEKQGNIVVLVAKTQTGQLRSYFIQSPMRKYPSVVPEEIRAVFKARQEASAIF